MATSSVLTITAVGDISFKGRYQDLPLIKVFRRLGAALDPVGLVMANLESPLVPIDALPVPGKCTLRGCLEWAAILGQSGIELVTLANNHMMDYGEEGLFSTMAALDKAGILYVGAGANRRTACLPVFREIAGRKVAFLARSSVEVSSLCYAGAKQPGVAFLDENELVETIRQCRRRAELVVVMLHWGMEHYHYPSPRQRLLAYNLVSAGADIVLGHHPHVLQGEERIGDSLISYSSGNFLFDEFRWTGIGGDGEERSYMSTLTDKNRQGMMLEAGVSADGAISTKQIFTKISSDAIVELDNCSARRAEYARLCSRLHLPLYDQLWKLYSLKREWDLRLSNQLSPSHIIRNLHKIRPRHFKEVAVKLRRSAKVSSGKSTNPYEG